jgi:hypothetical protein
MSAIAVEGLYFDEESEMKLLSHRLTIDDVQQVFDGAPQYYANQPGRRATHVMVGETDDDGSGRRTVLVVPIERWGGGLWRVVTAFEPSPEQEARYRSGT